MNGSTNTKRVAGSSRVRRKKSSPKRISEILADREEFRGKIKSYNALYSEIRKDEGFVSKSILGERASPSFSKLLGQTFEGHPGHEVIRKSGLLLFSADTISFSDFNEVIDSENPEQYEDLIGLQTKDERVNYIDLVHSVTSGSIPCAGLFSLYVLYLMSVDENPSTVSWCLETLNTKNARWSPNVQDILTIFVNWGVVDETLIPAVETTRSCQFSGNPPNSTILPHNISNVLLYLTIVFQRTKVDEEYVEVLLVALTRVSLEKGFRNPWLVKRCLSALFTSLSRNYWTLQKLQQLRGLVHNPADHFHNQAYLCLHVIPEGRLREMLGCSVLLQILDAPIALPRVISFKFLLGIVNSHGNISQLPLQKLYVFLSVLRMCIPAYTKPQQAVFFKGLIRCVQKCWNNLAMQAGTSDLDRIKEYICRLLYFWETMYKTYIRIQ